MITTTRSSTALILPLALAFTFASTPANAQLADLVPNSLTPSRATLVAGHRYDFQMVVKNNGIVRSGSCTAILEVDHGAPLAPDVQRIASFRLPAIAPLGGSWTGRMSFSMPRMLTGTKPFTRLRLRVDTDNEVRELDNFNNSLVVATQTVARPDLAITHLNATATDWKRGRAYAFSATVKNLGAAISTATRTSIYISRDNTLSTQDTLLTSFDEGPLASNGSRSHNHMVTIPSTAALGTNFVGYWTDDRGFVAEADESNNQRVVAGTLRAEGVHQSFGNGCLGKDGVPSLRAFGVPTIGQPVRYTLSRGRSRSAAIFALGLSRTRFGGSVRLPVDLGIVGARGCSIYTSHELLSAAVVDAGGTANTSLKLPQQTSLVGASFYTQWLVLSPGSNSFGLVVSNAMSTTIGN